MNTLNVKMKVVPELINLLKVATHVNKSIDKKITHLRVMVSCIVKHYLLWITNYLVGY